VANTVEIAGFGEIYGVQLLYGELFNSAIVELMYWDCENKEWLVAIVDDLRANRLIEIPYKTNNISGNWYACKYCTELNVPVIDSLYISSNMSNTRVEDFENQEIDLYTSHSTMTDDDCISENDILNYSLTYILDENSLFKYMESDTDSITETEKYDDLYTPSKYKNDFHNNTDFDALTEITQFSEENSLQEPHAFIQDRIDLVDTEFEYHPRVIFANVNIYENAHPHPIRRVRVA
jgi:hypothetical protein